MQPSFAFAIDNAAEVTAMTTDDKYLYVAGVFTNKVTFHSASATGKTEEVEGLKLNDAPVEYKSASFIAVYDLKGELQSVTTFVPEILPALVPKMEELSFFGEPMYSPSGADLFFHISDIQCYDGKLYFSARYTGETKIGDVTLNGSYQNLFDMFYYDVANSAVVSLDTETLTTAEIAMSVQIDKPVDGYAPGYSSITFNVSKAGLYGAFTTTASSEGEINVNLGSLSKTLSVDDKSPDYFVIANAENLTTIEKTATASEKPYNTISNVLVENGKVWMLGSADIELPSAKAGEGTAVTGSNDLFVATFSASDLSLKSVVGNASDEGTTDIPQSDGSTKAQPNYEYPQGAVTTNDYLMLVYNTLDFKNNYISSSTKLYTGTAFEDAKTTGTNSKEIAGATGIARNNGAGENPLNNNAIIILPYADSKELKFQYTGFNQDIISSGINAIAPDYVDENAPVEYYNLQGIRIANPAEGQIVIRRQGTKSEKIIF